MPSPWSSPRRRPFVKEGRVPVRLFGREFCVSAISRDGWTLLTERCEWQVVFCLGWFGGPYDLWIWNRVKSELAGTKKGRDDANLRSALFGRICNLSQRAVSTLPKGWKESHTASQQLKGNHFISLTSEPSMQITISHTISAS